MKNNRFGKASALEKDQLDLIISCLPDNHHRVIASICRHTACRISESTQLNWSSIGESVILFPKTITKGKLHSREIAISSSLDKILNQWRIRWRKKKLRNEKPDDYLFCGRGDKGIKKPISTPVKDFDFTFAQLQNTYDFLQDIDKDFAKFKKSAQKEVNYLVKEFERRKSAGAYARTTTSRTGILDTKNLHTYKFNEDLFKKISIVPDGKNHGLVFVLDWSGSMSHVMQDTIKQLYNLVWFCKKVQIPFEVYAFTSSYNKGEERRGFYKERSGLISMDGNFSMMNLLSSKVRSKDFNQQLINLYRVVSAFRGYHNHKVIPIGLNLSGTPLNEAVITLHDIIPQFQKETGVEKVNCVILTDGEAQSTSYHREIQRRWEDEPYIGRNTIGSGVFLRNRKTGRSSSFGNEWYGYTKVFLRDISQTFPDVNFVGIRLMDAREGSRFILCNQQGDGYTEGSFYKTKLAEWRKNKSLVLDNKEAGFDVYLGLSTSAMNNDTEFEVAEDATKAQIKSAFTKTLKNKKMNKKILSKFVEMVA